MKVFFIPDSFQGHFLRWGCSLMEKTMKGYFVFSFSFFFFATAIATPAAESLDLTTPRVVDVRKDDVHLRLGAKYKSTLLLVQIKDSSGVRRVLGSCTLVSQNEILAIINDKEVFNEHGSLGVEIEGPVKGQKLFLAKISSEPVFDEEENRLVYMRLDRKIRQSLVKPARLLKEADSPLVDGETVFKVGYGGTSGGSFEPFDLKRRAGLGTLALKEGDKIVTSEFVTDSNHPNYTDLGMSGAWPDLGGQWLRNEEVTFALWIEKNQGVLVTHERLQKMRDNGKKSHGWDFDLKAEDDDTTTIIILVVALGIAVFGLVLVDRKRRRLTGI
jgi:hypothetical protein